MTEFRVRVREKATGRYFEPAKAAADQTVTPSRPYEAAAQTPRLSRWLGNYGGPNAALGGSLQSLRSRSRDRRRNDGVADTAIEVLVSNAIGTGIKPQFTTPDAEFNKALNDLWETWVDQSDADGRNDFYGQQGLALASTAEGGDCFARMRIRRLSDGLAVPLQIQLLEGEYCPVERTEVLATGSIQQGVQFDLIGRRTAYWLYAYHPLDLTVSMSVDNTPSPVPAGDIAHLSAVRRPGQVRGEPWLARALVKLYDTDQVDDAMVLRQKIGAMFAGFVTPTAEGRFALQDGANEDGSALASLEPGTMQVLDPGTTVTFTNPPDPGDNFDIWFKAQMRKVASSAGILYEQLTGDYGAINDRTWRAAMNEFNRRLERLQHGLVVFQFCRPIMARWVSTAVLSGAIVLPKGITVERIAACKWVPPRRPYINPLTDVEAKIREIRAGLSSRSEAISEMGYNAETIDDEISRDQAREEELSLVFDTNASKVTSNGIAQIGTEEPQDGPPKPAR